MSLNSIPDQQLRVYYSNLMLEYPYEQMISKVIINTNPLIKDNLTEYRNKLTNNQPLNGNEIKLLTRRIFNNNKKDITIQNTTYLKNAFDFMNFGQSSPPEIQPILYYYSWSFFIAFFKHSLFWWNSPAKKHGMNVQLDNKLENITINFDRDSNGSFQRFIDCLTVLGIPNISSLWLPFPKNKSLTFKKNSCSHIFLSNNITLENILNFKMQEDFTVEINQIYDLPFRYELVYLNEEILSYILIFIASNIARYRPILWKKVISGTDEVSAKMNKRIKEAYRHYMEGSYTIKKIQCDSEGNFLKSINRIFELMQNAHWLSEGYKGFFI